MKTIGSDQYIAFNRRTIGKASSDEILFLTAVEKYMTKVNGVRRQSAHQRTLQFCPMKGKRRSVRRLKMHVVEWRSILREPSHLFDNAGMLNYGFTNTEPLQESHRVGPNGNGGSDFK